jgi:hypothetical protein
LHTVFKAAQIKLCVRRNIQITDTKLFIVRTDLPVKN